MEYNKSKGREEYNALNKKNIYKEVCANCGSTENLQLHHVVPLAKGGTNNESNLITLCGDCHAKVHNFKTILTKEWKEKQMAGVARAKAEGKFTGRKPIEIEENLFQEYYNKYMTRKINKVQMAKELKISRPTLDKLLKEYNDKLIKQSIDK